MKPYQTTDNTNTKIWLTTLTEITFEALIDIQTILQILVNHGITTKDEVDDIRKIVSSQPKYQEFYKNIQTRGEELEEVAKIEDIYTRYLTDKDSVTEEEIQFIRNYLDKMM